MYIWPLRYLGESRSQLAGGYFGRNDSQLRLF